MKLPLILAIDFDLTIVYSHPFPKIQGLRSGVKKYINKLYDQGYYIIIWTCRTDNEITNDQTEAIEYLKKNGVMYHEINTNHYALKNCFKNDCRKIAADMYIDDKGLWLFGLPRWSILYKLIKWKSKFARPLLGHCKKEDFELKK